MHVNTYKCKLIHKLSNKCSRTCLLETTCTCFDDRLICCQLNCSIPVCFEIYCDTWKNKSTCLRALFWGCSGHCILAPRCLSREITPFCPTMWFRLNTHIVYIIIVWEFGTDQSHHPTTITTNSMTQERFNELRLLGMWLSSYRMQSGRSPQKHT